MQDMIHSTLGDFLDDIARQYPDQKALIHHERNCRLNYKEFNEACRQAAKGFLQIGIKKGDHVAIWATNYPQWIITMFATAKIGAVLVTVNTNYKRFELEYLMRQSDSMTLLIIEEFKDSKYIEIVNELLPELGESEPGNLSSSTLPRLKNIITLDNRQQPGMFTWDDILALGASLPDEELDRVQSSLDPHDVVNMQYTSGTTGFPKGVMLTHFNILNNGFYIGEGMGFSPKDSLLIQVPLFHCFGCVLGVMASVTHAATMVLIDAFSPTEMLKTIARERCTAVHGVPTMFIIALDHPDFEKYDLSSLRTGIMAGSPCPIQVMRHLIDKMYMKDVSIVFGQTESSPGLTQTTLDDTIEDRVSTVGRAFPNTELRIVDPETNQPVAPGIQGEICARGYCIMKGYYNMPEATKNAIDEDGWLHTGDLGVVDERGYYKITGRIKDMIIRGGENIYPREIEELLYTNSEVQDVQVVGVPSRAHGEEVMAYIIKKEGSTVTEDEIKEFVKKNMARHKVPRYVQFVDAFPMTASGKIQKFKLREMAIETLGLHDEANIETA